MKILLAEDEPRLGSMIKNLLEQDGFQTDWVASGDLAYEHARNFSYNILILDWMMPQETGLSVCQRLRNDGYKGGILMLTCRDGIDDRISGFDVGADDYIIKPFKYKELWARIRALSRRISREQGQEEPAEEFIRIADLELRSLTRGVYRGNKEILLTGREFQIFQLLALQQGQVLSQEKILNCIWGVDSEVSPSTLERFISQLRKKVERDEKRFIHNIKGQGYKMEIQHA